jgi:hypothetical protein
MSGFKLKTSTTLEKGPVLASPPSMFDGFNAHHAKLGGAPGRRLSRIEFVGGSRRVRYENGIIYERPERFAWVHGAIEGHYNLLGGASSRLGLPLADEMEMSEGGRVSVFDNGNIYWWPDVGAIDLGNVVVHFTGLMCFGETDSDGGGSNSDEVYAVIGVIAPSGGREILTQTFEDVDGGESRPDLVELFQGPPQGLVLDVLLVEHDEADPNKYRQIVGQAVEKGMQKLAPVISKVVAGVPVVGPVLAVAASELLPALAPFISDVVNDLLGTDDEVLGRPTIALTAKQMVVLAARTPNSDIKGVGFKFETPLISSQGASYKVYFGIVPV